MKRPPAHEIDEKAQKVFKSALPDAWVIRPQTPDYGIDYHIELVADHSVTGVLAGVQLKGATKLKSGEDHVALSIPTKNLIYYADDATIPVFLVVVDTTKGIGYWCFLQEYVQRKLKGSKWRTQDSKTIHIPKENQLSDQDRFEQAIRDADEFMKSYRPGSIGPSIKAEEHRLASLDPRFQVRLSASKGTEDVEINAIEPVEIKLTFKGADACRKADDLVNKGLPVEFSPGEVQVIGSPLFERINADVVQIHSKRTWDVDVELLALGKDSERCLTRVRFDGQLEGGCTELRFSGEMKRAPLVLTFTLHVEDQKQSVTCTLSYDYTRWAGQRLSQLAYFDQLDKLVCSVAKGSGLRILGSCLGYRFLDAEIDPLKFQSLPLMRLVPVLKKARHVAEVSGVDPMLPQVFRRQDADEILELYELLTKGVHRQLASKARVFVVIAREGLRQWLEKIYQAGLGDGPLTVDLGGEPWNFLGENVAGYIGSITRTLSHPRLQQTIEELTRQLETTQSEEFTLTFEGGEDSELITEAARFSTVGKDPRSNT